MKNLLGAFSLTLREWQNIKALLLHIEQSGKTTKDLIDYIDNLVAVEREFQKKFKMPKKLCPKCQRSMGLLPVNINEATQTEDDSKSVWLCPNKECMHAEYSTKTVQEWMEEITKKK